MVRPRVLASFWQLLGEVAKAALLQTVWENIKSPDKIYAVPAVVFNEDKVGA